MPSCGGLPTRLQPNTKRSGPKMRQTSLVAFRPMKLFLALVLFSITAHAGKYIVLANGFRIHADSHVVDGAVMRLQISQGAVEIPANSVATIEVEDYRPPPPPAAAAPAPEPQRELTTQELITRAAIHNGL